MRLILRVTGTWMLGLALVLLIIDGIKSLGANRLVITSLGDAWAWLNAESLAATQQFLTSRFFGAMLDTALSALLTFPGWAVLVVPGVLLAWAGRTRRARLFVRHDQV
jgi:hypothetical protein